MAWRIDLGDGERLTLQHYGLPPGDYLEVLYEIRGAGSAMYLHWLLTRGTWAALAAATRDYFSGPGSGEQVARPVLEALAPFDGWTAEEGLPGPAPRPAVHCDYDHVEFLVGAGDRYALLSLPWRTWLRVVEGARREWSAPGRERLV